MKIFRRYFYPLAEMVITRMILKMSLIHMFSNVLLVLIKFKMMTILTMTMMAKMMLLKMMVVIVLKMSLDRTLPQWATGPAHLGTGLGEPLDRLVLGRRPVPATQGPAGSSQTAGYRARGDDGTTVGPRSLPATPLQFHNVCSHGVCHHHHHRCCRCFRSLLRHKDTLPLARIEFSVLAPSAEFMSDGVTVDFTLVCGPRKAAHE